MLVKRILCAAVLGVAFMGSACLAGTVNIEDVARRSVEQSYGRPAMGKSVDGNPLTLGGVVYPHGLGTHAESLLTVDLGGQGERFTAMIGVDDEMKGKGGSVTFTVTGDGKKLYESGIIRSGEAPKKVDVDVTGVKFLALVVGDAGDGIDCDHADWADGQFVMKGDAKPKAAAAPPSEPVILTPAVGPSPRINGARVFGVRPGKPVLYTIAATGDRPMKFDVEGLPAGLTVDAAGRISGTLDKAGEYSMTLVASNDKGTARRPFKIVVGDNLALTPPMGWNSWNCWAGAVDQDKMLRAAKAMVSTGLIDHGWTYVNIDDTWEAGVGGPLNATQANNKFPDMKGMCDQIHAMGLKAGLYSSPGPKTCANFTGSYQHEKEDAQQWAEWGFDYIKYDWCSYGGVVKGDGSLPTLKKPYKLLGDILKEQKRDIVFSLCQYGMGNVASWGPEVGGQCWRTTGDIVDSWGSVNNIAKAQVKIQKYISPGHWNDPDMLVVGMVGWGPRLHPTRLTPDEQYTHISLWCMLQSPMLLGCDLERLDPFTLNLLTNDEVLDINQDPAGKGAVKYAAGNQTDVWVKELADGSHAVGLFNRGFMPETVKAVWKDLGINSNQQARDLWRQKDLGTFADTFEATVPPHGVVLVKVSGK